MVRVKVEHFGFDKIGNQFLKYEKNVDKAKVVLEKHADVMKKSASQIATSKKLVKTGEGVLGIDKEKIENGFNVGWSPRPRFHLYFHELGFHAVDNRQKQTIRRDTKGARKRRYGNVKATYVPPTPHMRPAFEQNQAKFLIEMVKTVQDDS